MIDTVAARTASADPLNVMREYLQSRVLLALQRSGAMVSLAFHGGTALRFLYRIRRFSEDLDFALERRDAGYDFRAYMDAVERVLRLEGYTIRARLNDSSVVHKAMLGFAGAPFEAGVSPHADQVFWVKIEVDTNPPAGASLETTLVDRYGLLRLNHHDIKTLFAGKLAAVLCREYTKGRDLYDLMWYLADDGRPEPNLTMLANALEQNGRTHVNLDGVGWLNLVEERLMQTEWGTARDDVRRFLEEPAEIELLEPATFDQLLDRWSQRYAK
jgi:predicted nucleotidyltransferase component of viral defense system